MVVSYRTVGLRLRPKMVLLPTIIIFYPVQQRIEFSPSPFCQLATLGEEAPPLPTLRWGVS